MSEWNYSDEELQNYFSDPAARGAQTPPPPPQARPDGFWYRRVANPKLAQALGALSIIVGVLIVGTIGGVLYLASLSDELPAIAKIENPEFQLATIAYTADGEELARYAQQNRSWASYNDISPHVINALISTEDQRFYRHWGIDMQGWLAVFKDVITKFDLRGASTITMQLARNLYNTEIGRAFSIERKLKEMVTAISLEKRYTKREIVEMYVNTVDFGYHAYGIESAARYYFGKDPIDLNELESATLVGMLQGTTLYHPINRPERSQRRRNQVLINMVNLGHLPESFIEENKDVPVEAKAHSFSVTASAAPHFAEHIRKWLEGWAAENGRDLYTDGLRIYTTIDGALQAEAQAAVEEQMEGLQAVVDVEWSRRSNPRLGTTTKPYLERTDYEPFAYFWESREDDFHDFIRESVRYRRMVNNGTSEADALSSLLSDDVYLDSLKTNKTRLEAGLISIEPKTGYVKAWVGGRNLEEDWNDHVAGTRRQPGSTFKPFVYTTAIDNGYSPMQQFMDSVFVWVNPYTGDEWSPRNSGSAGSRTMMTLREGLARSKNTISGRLILDIGHDAGPREVVFYARRMGIESPLDPVPALALGTSDVSLYEMAGAYSTFANGGLYNEPVAITRITDRFGNVLYEHIPNPKEALSEQTAFTMVDMMRDVVQYGTAVRINNSYGLREYDLAGKTGTTQNSADGWFMMMHPDLVTGAWVGFNDRRMAFRSNWWGQGAHNALFLVGDYMQRSTNTGIGISKDSRFPTPEEMGFLTTPEIPNFEDRDRNRSRVGW